MRLDPEVGEHWIADTLGEILSEGWLPIQIEQWKLRVLRVTAVKIGMGAPDYMRQIYVKSDLTADFAQVCFLRGPKST